MPRKPHAVVVTIASKRFRQMGRRTSALAAPRLIPAMWTCAIAASGFTRRRRARNVGSGFGKDSVCPKMELDGIPEFHVLARALSVVYVKVHDASSIRELRIAASVMGVKYCKSLSKQTLGRRVRARLGQPVGTGKRKRSHAELVDAVTAAGGVVRWYESVRGRRVRCRMSKPSMEAFLRES